MTRREKRLIKRNKRKSYKRISEINDLERSLEKYPELIDVIMVKFIKSIFQSLDIFRPRF